MPRGYATDEATYAPLVRELEAHGGELPAPRVQEFLGISDPRNMARHLQRAIELDLLHRVRQGAKSFYRAGPDPDSTERLGDFEPVLYGDGTLVLRNCPLNADDVPQLNRAQASRLKRLLTGELV